MKTDTLAQPQGKGNKVSMLVERQRKKESGLMTVIPYIWSGLNHTLIAHKNANVTIQHMHSGS